MNRNEIARAVMADAWNLYRATVAEEPAAANRATFTFCLRFAWEREPSRYASKIRKSWEEMGAARQLDACRRMALAAAGTYAAKTSGYVDFNRLDPEDLASDTWIIMQERVDTLEAVQAARNRRGQLPLPLGVLLHRAAAEALRRAIRRTDNDEIGGEAYDTATRAAESPQNTADNVMIREALESIREPEQRAVLELLIAGLTVREIAVAVNRSKSSVQRMIDSIRTAIAARLAA